jgi:hypothetical protein
VAGDAGRVADDDGVRRHVLGDDGRRPDDRPVADRDAGEDRGVRPDPHVAAEDDVALRAGGVDVVPGDVVTRSRSCSASITNRTPGPIEQ